MSTYLPAVTHTVLALGLLAAYVTLRALGHDETALLGILGGYIGGAGVNALAVQTAALPGSSSGGQQ